MTMNLIFRDNLHTRVVNAKGETLFARWSDVFNGGKREPGMGIQAFNGLDVVNESRWFVLRGGLLLFTGLTNTSGTARDPTVSAQRRNIVEHGALRLPTNWVSPRR